MVKGKGNKRGERANGKYGKIAQYLFVSIRVTSGHHFEVAEIVFEAVPPHFLHFNFMFCTPYSGQLVSSIRIISPLTSTLLLTWVFYQNFVPPKHSPLHPLCN